MDGVAVNSVNDVPIRLTVERWQHIVSRHPEMEPHRSRVTETVKDPDFVARGRHGELKAVRLFIDLPIGARYLIVIYREISHENGFIITARLGTDVGNVIRGGVVWRRK